MNVTVNGIDNKDNTVGGPVMQLPAEAVQEFQISTQRFSAVNGRSAGAAINVITKSGSNNFHGSAFGFFRDQALNADQKLANGDGTPLPPIRPIRASGLADRSAGRSRKTSCSPFSPWSGSANILHSPKIPQRSSNCNAGNCAWERSLQQPFPRRSLRTASTAASTIRSTTSTRPICRFPPRRTTA